MDLGGLTWCWEDQAVQLLACRARRSSWTLALAVFAAPAVGESATRSLNFTTGSFVVNCTSSEELCSPAEKLTLSLPRPGTVSAIAYTTAATHCSAVLVHVLHNGHQIAKQATRGPVSRQSV